ncbi:SMI1/KNR4 family protein [Bacillus sp. DX4.1]|uniref:SMI1/KNR4 family protein n=1 Tax=Bacillus sp. DX4.1 TaxID=3055867 RepID=UPI0025A2BC20|nr:SMI1/KNR4 family protein [Bacillus sp. DX4.1]MDM5186393.1 SMI1/KNR4 family protein [Bacillus sp. DX4.1]
MVKIVNLHKNLSLEEIEEFETEHQVSFTKKYKRFLMKWNGGYPEPSFFKVSDKQGVSVLNEFYGIGDIYSNLGDYIDIYEYRLPDDFVPIANDPGGNVICLGTKEPYYEKIYFWDHEQEPEDPDDMSNMYFLASDIDEFLNSLYEDDDEYD